MMAPPTARRCCAGYWNNKNATTLCWQQSACCCWVFLRGGFSVSVCSPEAAQRIPGAVIPDSIAFHPGLYDSTRTDRVPGWRDDPGYLPMLRTDSRSHVPTLSSLTSIWDAAAANHHLTADRYKLTSRRQPPPARQSVLR